MKKKLIFVLIFLESIEGYKVFPFWVILLSTAQTSFRMVDQSLELKIQRIWKSPQCVHQESYWVRKPHPPVLFWLMMITGVPSILIVRSS